LIKQVREQFALLDEWHLELDKVTESDENGRVLSSDRELLESLVKKARNEFKINISKEIDEIVSQVKDVEAWEDATRKLIESDQLSKIDEARNLLKTVRDDKEENYNIID
jgi:hypothetical protein